MSTRKPAAGLVAAAITIGAAALLAVPARAQDANDERAADRPTTATQRLMVNGRPVQPDVNPQTIRGRMMVPIRFVAEALGAGVTWDPQTRTVRLLQGDERITMTIGSTTTQVNGLPRVLEVPPMIRDGRTLLPLRAVARFTGGSATYNPRTRVVFVKTRGPGEPAAPISGAVTAGFQ